MKIITLKYRIMLVSAFLLLSSMNCSEHKKKNVKSEEVIRPNIGDINASMKLIKPFIDAPFLPQEVDKLSSLKRKRMNDTPMTNAIIVGPQPTKDGLSEKPTMYSTVVESHSTVVMHPQINPHTMMAHPGVTAAFSMDPSQYQTEEPKLSPGAYSIPIRIQGGSINDPTLSGYETPNFIHKKETVLSGNQNQQTSNNQQNPGNTQTILQNSSNNDINEFVSQFDNAKDKSEKIGILTNGKKRLGLEAQTLSQNVASELKDLLFAKEVALKLQALLAKYDNKTHQDSASHLKLADEVTLKNLLRAKLQREMQGFRTSPGEYKELEQVNPTDLQRIIHEIKNKIGN